ncbi:hypothetical protein BD560DRAFT_395217 [Blakeslea trispora]|nr:hypothetical protein BD560DRAFT_395217 [Blakeslea trispora]
MTKSQLSLRLYDSAQEFLADNTSDLSLHEVQNIFLMLSAKHAEKEGLPFYGNAVWDLEENRLVLALIWYDGNSLYASHVPESHCKEAMDLALSDLTLKNPTVRTNMYSMHAFQPAFDYIKSAYSSITDVPLSVSEIAWSHTIYRQNATLRLPDTSKAGEFKLATDDLVDDYLVPWLEAFIEELNANGPLTAAQLIEESIREKFAYVLYNQEGVPVSMACKRRPTSTGCSVAFVYTPPAHRGHQYASVCVGLLTELILKEYDYATLFVVHARDPYKNLYTDLGYQLSGEAGRLLFSVNQKNAA